MKKPHQHFIPITYLKRFSHTNNNKTYFVDGYNKTEKKVVKSLSVKNICVEKDIYTLKELNGDEKYNLENYFMNNIESKYSETYRILVTEKKEFITPKERINILITTLSMYFRTPKFLNNFSDFSTRFIKQLQEKSVSDSIEFLGASISLKNKSFDEIKKQIKEHNRIDHFKMQIELFHQYLKHKIFDGLTVIELTGKGEFITSDNPVQIINSSLEGFDLFNTGNSIYIPLNNKHALFIAPKFEGSIINKVFYTKDNFFQHIALNNSVLKSAERWVFGSKSGISQLILDEEKYNLPADGNNPIIKKFDIKLEMMQNILKLTEKGITNQNFELIACLKDLPNHPMYNEFIDFQDIYNKMKAKGLNI